MRIYIYIILFTLIWVKPFSQAPQGINYQGVARSANGSPLVNQVISLKFGILNGSATGTLMYSETQTITTGSAGLFNITIGGGTPVTGAFSAIT